MVEETKTNIIDNDIPNLSFPEFGDIKTSTKTYTANTNIKLNIEKIFDFLPITEYVLVVKKRGRKKKVDNINPNKDVPEGSIITIKYQDKIKGVELKPQKAKAKAKTKWFRNSITIIIVLDKLINFKMCCNGTFQMTGCKNHQHAESCVKYIWKYIRNQPDLYTFTNKNSGTELEVLFIPSMCNIDFSVGFIIDREKLNNYLCKNNNFEYNNQNLHCLLETSFGYTGVNIKIPIKKPIEHLKIIKLVYSNQHGWQKYNTTYQEYLKLLTPKEQKQKLKSKKYNTFLVFHSGKVIMSGINQEYMIDIYYFFLEIIRNGYIHIREILDI